jgi:hypothetical protein
VVSKKEQQKILLHELFEEIIAISNVALENQDKIDMCVVTDILMKTILDITETIKESAVLYNMNKHPLIKSISERISAKN